MMNFQAKAILFSIGPSSSMMLMMQRNIIARPTRLAPPAVQAQIVSGFSWCHGIETTPGCSPNQATLDRAFRLHSDKRRGSHDSIADLFVQLVHLLSCELRGHVPRSHSVALFFCIHDPVSTVVNTNVDKTACSLVVVQDSNWDSLAVCVAVCACAPVFFCVSVKQLQAEVRSASPFL